MDAEELEKRWQQKKSRGVRGHHSLAVRSSQRDAGGNRTGD
ncbi:hypothetical protein [Ktedonosporobacter rubrisoli]|nr:hypothetical protein [Ktedonosporobacter rubrisoli]